MNLIPVTREQTQIFWCGREVKLDDCKDVCQYIDFCLHMQSESGFPQHERTRDFGLLLDLANAIDNCIPWFTEEEKNNAKETLPEEVIEPLEPKFRGYPFGHAAINYVDILSEIKRMERQLKSMRRQDQELETELEFLTMRRDAYFKHIANHNGWKARIVKQRKWYECCKRNVELYHIIKDRWQRYHLNKRIILRQISTLEAAIKDDSFVYERLPWNILPEGESLFPAVHSHVKALIARYPQKRYAPERLQKLEQLKPDKAYFGSGEFDGYFVFLFCNSSYAVLECPWVGNALYLLKGNWVELSKLSKQTLLTKHQDAAARLIHDADDTWLRILKATLRRSM